MPASRVLIYMVWYEFSHIFANFLLSKLSYLFCPFNYDSRSRALESTMQCQ